MTEPANRQSCREVDQAGKQNGGSVRMTLVSNEDVVAPAERAPSENQIHEHPPVAERRNGKNLGAVLKRLAVPAIIMMISVAIVVAGGIFTVPAQPIHAAPRPLAVNVVVATRVSGYQAKRHYLGKIESKRHSRLSFEFAGKINTVHVDEGQPVQKGELLAELDTEILRSSLGALTAQIESATALLDELIAGPRSEDIAAAQANVRRWTSQLKLAQITRQRMDRLLKSRAVSDQEVDEAVYNEQSVAAQMDLAKSNLDELVNGTRIEQIAAQRAALNQLRAEHNTVAVQIRKSQLRAPFSGIVAARLLDEGEVIKSGQPVYELLDNQHLKARIGLPVESLPHVSDLEQHELLYRDQKFVAKFRSVKPEKNTQTRTVDVVFELPPMLPAPSIGDVVRFELSEPADSPGYWIPTSALVETYRGLWGCYVAVEMEPNSGLAISGLRELEILHQEGERSFVRGALVAGEKVITSGVHRLVNEQAIRVVRNHGGSALAAVKMERNTGG